MVLTFIRSLVFKSNSLRPWDIALHREWEFLEDHSHSVKYLRGGQGSQDWLIFSAPRWKINYVMCRSKNILFSYCINALYWNLIQHSRFP